VVHRSRPAPTAEQAASQLDRIRARGTLRVGYLPDAMPYSYFNNQGDLVGFDVELAHQLASELNLRLEFIPVDRESLDDVITSGECDLIMAGVAVTTVRASQQLYSTSYLDETLSFVVPDEDRDRFMDWNDIRARGAIKVAVPAVPYYMAKLHEMVPQAELVSIPDIRQFFLKGSDAVGAIALPAERGSTWTLIFPQYSVVVPGPQIMKVPLAYPIARHDEALASFVNTWIELKRKDGTIDALYQYWILGRNARPPVPRWSIMRNVLHWVE